GAITVKVTPKVEVNKGETAKLPCTYTGINLQDVVESQGLRTRVGFRENSGKQMSDPGTPLTGRVNIEENLTLNIMSVKPSDELTYYCQVTAGKDGSGEGSTKLEVFGT
ncbi:hypothetical protein XENOCAPTIV_005162, partial [Xenoophorus captivus]